MANPRTWSFRRVKRLGLGAMREPTSSREARLRNFFSKNSAVLDFFFDYRDWPWYAQDHILRAHKERESRYFLVRFFILNNVPEVMARDWITITDVFGTTVVRGQYDAAAMRDIDGLIQRCQRGAFDNAPWTDMRTGLNRRGFARVVPLPPRQAEVEEYEEQLEYARRGRMFVADDAPIWLQHAAQRERQRAKRIARQKAYIRPYSRMFK